MAMQTRILGRIGLELGVIGLGTEQLPTDRKNMDAVIDLAVSEGVNYIETIGPSICKYREKLILTLIL